MFWRSKPHARLRRAWAFTLKFVLLNVKFFDSSDKLEDAGPLDAATSEAASQMRNLAIALIADIMDNPNRANIKSRLAALYRTGDISLENMIEAGCDAEICEFVVRSTGKLARKNIRHLGLAHLLKQ